MTDPPPDPALLAKHSLELYAAVNALLWRFDEQQHVDYYDPLVDDLERITAMIRGDDPDEATRELA